MIIPEPVPECTLLLPGKGPPGYSGIFLKLYQRLFHINSPVMKMPWFKGSGILFIPASIMGWLIFVACLVYAVYSFIDIDSRSHSASDTLMNFFFRVCVIFVIYSIVAYLTSGNPKKDRQNSAG